VRHDHQAMRAAAQSVCEPTIRSRAAHVVSALANKLLCSTKLFLAADGTSIRHGLWPLHPQT
jgi:hypothetical protein